MGWAVIGLSKLPLYSAWAEESETMVPLLVVDIISHLLLIGVKLFRKKMEAVSLDQSFQETKLRQISS